MVLVSHSQAEQQDLQRARDREQQNKKEVDLIRMKLEGYSAEIESLVLEETVMLADIERKKKNVEEYQRILGAFGEAEDVMVINAFKAFEERRTECQAIERAKGTARFNQCFLCRNTFSVIGSNCIQCGGCTAWLCLSCAGLNEEEFETYKTSTKKEFFCRFLGCKVMSTPLPVPCLLFAPPCLNIITV